MASTGMPVASKSKGKHFMKAELLKDDVIQLVPENEFEKRGLRNVSRGPYNIYEDKTRWNDPEREEIFVLRRVNIHVGRLRTLLEDIQKSIDEAGEERKVNETNGNPKND